MITGPLSGAWADRYPKASSALKAWAHEFCAARGKSAHARKRGTGAPVWRAEAHLAFASILFPLLVKQGLDQRGVYAMSGIDRLRLREIERWLVHDPFAGSGGAPFEKHPWTAIESELKNRLLHEQVLAGLSSVLDAS